MMEIIEELKSKIKEHGKTIIEERSDFIVPEIFIDSMPGVQVTQGDSRRNKLYRLTPFFIKNHDAGKLSSDNLTPIEEIKNEIIVCSKFEKTNNEHILLVKKIAILYVKEEPFLVEMEIEPFNEQKFKSLELLDKAYQILKIAKEKFKEVGDFKLGNLGYDYRDKKIKFFDVFPIL